jgi:hypothetical protein
MEAEVAKGRRDWAFSERDKVSRENLGVEQSCQISFGPTYANHICTFVPFQNHTKAYQRSIINVILGMQTYLLTTPGVESTAKSLKIYSHRLQ